MSFTVQVDDKVLGPVVKHMGDVNDGDHGVGIELGPITVDSPATAVTFNYQIVNAGHSGDTDVDEKLTSGALALLAKVFGAGTVWTVILGYVISFLGGILFADCDGAVAVDQISVRGDTLWAWTHGVGPHSETRYYPGTDSPWGCGDNSRYTVTWSVIGNGVVPPPVNAQMSRARMA